MSQTHDHEDDGLLDLDDEDSSIEELESQVQKAQEQLLTLRRQQDVIERQKQELEELSRKQSEFEKGKGEMCESFHRALVSLEREDYENQKRAEQIRTVRESFTTHLETLEGINPKHWSKAQLAGEISRALAAVEDARTEFTKCKSIVNAGANREVIDEEPAEGLYEVDAAEHGFVYWLKAGFAFTLPLLVLGLLILLFLWLQSPPAI